VILVPLAFVVMVNGIKDFLEDYKRKKSDDEENNKKCLVYDDQKGNFLKKKWGDIKLGDIIKVFKDEYFPADLILINTSEKNGECFIETKNLDGETNLKFKQSQSTIRFLFPDESRLSDFSGVLKTKLPNHLIYEFDAILKFESKKFAGLNKQNISNLIQEVVIEKINLDNNEILSNDKIYKKNNDIIILDEKNTFDLNYETDNFKHKQNSFKRSVNDEIIIDKTSFLLRGCSLKNTDFIIGVCVYLGHHTKIMKNSPNAKHKTSKVDNLMNKQILIILLFQIFFSIIACLFYFFWYERQKQYISYVFLVPFNFNLLIFIKRMGTWILIFTNLVPISLLVTLEMIKFVQGMYISWDIEMYDQQNCISAKVQTSTLNEELGQVKVNL